MQGVAAVAGGFGEIDRKLAWLKNFLEMCEAGDDIVGATPKSLALRVDLKRQINELLAARPRGDRATVAPATRTGPGETTGRRHSFSPNAEVSHDQNGEPK